MTEVQPLEQVMSSSAGITEGDAARLVPSLSESAENTKDQAKGPIFLWMRAIEENAKAETTAKGASKFAYYSAILAAARQQCTEVVFNKESKAWKESDIEYKGKKGAVRRRNWRNNLKLCIVNIRSKVRTLPVNQMTEAEKKDILLQCEELLKNPNVAIAEVTYEEVVEELKAKLESVNKKNGKARKDAVTRLRVYYGEHKDILQEQMSISQDNTLDEGSRRLIEECEEICFLEPRRKPAKEWITNVETNLARKRTYDDYKAQEGPDADGETLSQMKRDQHSALSYFRYHFADSNEEEPLTMLLNPVLEDESKLKIIANLEKCRMEGFISDNMWAKLEPEIGKTNKRIMSERLEDLKEQYHPLNRSLFEKIQEIQTKDVGGDDKELEMRKLQEGEDSIVKRLEVLDKEIEACGKDGVAFLQDLKKKRE